jgi:hypothetical protein
MSDAMSRRTKRTASGNDHFTVPTTSVQRVEADGVHVFYRAAGDPNAPVVLLLHGFQNCSNAGEHPYASQPSKLLRRAVAR